MSSKAKPEPKKVDAVKSTKAKSEAPKKVLPTMNKIPLEPRLGSGAPSRAKKGKQGK